MVRLQLLGTLALGTEGEGPSGVLVHAKRVALLSYLALAQPRGFHRRDRLYALLWPEADTERARNSLRQAIHQLRQSVGAEVIRSRGDEDIGLGPGALTCDALELERAVADGRHADAVTLYGGELLSGFHVPGARDFSDWLDQERERLSDLATHSAWWLAEDCARSGAPADAARVARLAVSWRPFNEASNRRLIELLDRLGDTAGALRAYDAFADRLRVELESAPSEATTALVRGIRERSPVLPPPPDWAAPLETPADRRTRRWRPGMLYAAGLLTVLAVAAIWQGGRGVSAGRVDPARVTVFPFDVRGPTELQYLGQGMVDLLSAKLEGAVGFHASDPHSVVAALTARTDSQGPTLATYARLAERLGSGRFIVGNLVQAGAGIQLNASLHDHDARPLTAASVAGAVGDLLDLVDGLTGQLLAGVTGARDTTLVRLAALTTHSLPALKAFLEGEQAFRAGHDARAAEGFRQAAAIDSTFALAHYRLAMLATWVSNRDVPDPLARAAAAARHAEKLTPLVRDLLAGYQAYKEVRPEAERIYAAITAARPDNVEAWFMLAETRFHYNAFKGRSPLEAWPAFRRVLALDPANAHATVHLARLAVSHGRIAALDSVAADYLGRFADAERGLEMRALVAFAHDDTAARPALTRAAREADEIVALSVLLGAVFYAQDLVSAAELAPRFAGARPLTPSVVFAHRILSELGLMAGQTRRDVPQRLLGPQLDRDWLLESTALVAAEPFYEMPRAWIAAIRDSVTARRTYPALVAAPFRVDPRQGPMMQRYLLGLLSLRLGDTAAARAHLEGLHASAADQVAAMLAVGLRAEMRRGRGDLRGALAELEGLPDTLAISQRITRVAMKERFLHGELLVALGRDAEALPWYESLQSGFDAIYLAPAQLRCGEIHERLRQREAAAFRYARFIRMWRDADPELQPLVARARAGLARVSGR